ncbi:MAG: SDR family oxidoreductase [Bacteroidota bacterium]
MSQVLIIGASHGIGRALLEQQLPVRSCINMSRTSAGVSAPNFSEYQLDVLDAELPELDDLQSIVYCPGTINLKPINSLKEEQLLEDFRINVYGAYRVIRRYVKTLKKAANPSIVLFSTVAVSQGMPFHSSVAASKGAIEGMVRALAAELAPRIRVNAIAPTITDTPLAKNILRNESMVEKMKERHPLKRILQAEEVAKLASYLISEDAVSMTGQILRIDAGMSGIQ